MMRFFKRQLWTGAVLLGLLLPGTARAVTLGDPFPDFTVTNSLSRQECDQLGLEYRKDFGLEDLSCDIIVLEFLNVYCHTCRMQVAKFNRLFTAIRENPALSAGVCLLGIAVGNSREEVLEFKKNYGVSYPVVTDPRKEVFGLTGNIQGTPHTYIIRKDTHPFVIDYHAGAVESSDRYLATLTHALRGEITGTQPGNKAPPFSFRSRGSLITNASFSGKKVLFYFPADKTYPTAIDARNPAQQTAILSQVMTRFTDLNLVLFPSPGFSPALLHNLKGDHVYPVEQTPAETASQFRPEDAPAVYYINEFGRVVYAGESITLYNASAILEGIEYKPVLDMGDDEIIALIERQLRKRGNDVIGTEKELLDGQNAIYITSLAPKRQRRFLLSRLESRPTLCDICHDTHFIYTIDQSGVIVEFIPVQITKLGNVPWTGEDEQSIEKSILGRSIFDSFPFSPKTDAVSTATMSSSLVYESLDKGKKLFQDYKGHQFRSQYWKSVCFNNICALQERVREKKQSGEDAPLTNATLKALASAAGIPGCPLEGLYVVLDGSILCSYHGMPMGPCNQGQTNNAQHQPPHQEVQ